MGENQKEGERSEKSIKTEFPTVRDYGLDALPDLSH